VRIGIAIRKTYEADEVVAGAAAGQEAQLPPLAQEGLLSADVEAGDDATADDDAPDE
jgi:hypothetical protein